jgi:hypothetical protein
MRNGDGDGMRQILVARWAGIGDKVVTLAKEFPPEQFEFRPAPGVRSFADQLRHVAFWNQYVEKTMRGEQADGTANELSPQAYAGKKAVVGALRKSFDGVKSVLESGGGVPPTTDLDSLVSFIQHGAEHYGQLVVYYRLNGLVPPASRG